MARMINTKKQYGGTLTSLLDILFSAFGAVIVMTIIFTAMVNNPKPTSFVEIMVTTTKPFNFAIEISNKWKWVNGKPDSKTSNYFSKNKQEKESIFYSDDKLFTHLLLENIPNGEYDLNFRPIGIEGYVRNAVLIIRQPCKRNKLPLIEIPIHNHDSIPFTFEVKEPKEMCADD